MLGHYQVLLRSKFDERERGRSASKQHETTTKNVSEELDGQPWNSGTSKLLQVGETAHFGFTLITSKEISTIEESLLSNNFPVAVGIPSFILHIGMQGARLTLKWRTSAELKMLMPIEIYPADSLQLIELQTSRGMALTQRAFALRPSTYIGRVRLTIGFTSKASSVRRNLTLHYFITEAIDDVVTHEI